MKRYLDTRKWNWMVVVALLVLLATGNQPLFSGTMATATVQVQVQPEAYTETAGVSSWIASGGFSALHIPMKIKIRLNSGTLGVLSVSTSAGTPLGYSLAAC